MVKNHDDRIDHTRQTTMWLFKNRDCEQYDIVTEVGQTTSREGALASSLLHPYTPQLFIISPIARRVTPVPPNAPIKPRKPFSKEGLKPKKLRFTDKETDETKDENCFQKSADFSKTVKIHKQKATFLKQREQSESKERSERESSSAMLQSIRFELFNKKNSRCGRYEKRTRNNRSTTKEHAKNNNDSLQSSILNYNPKGFEKYPTILSPCNDKWSKEKKLLWLQPRRDVGMWIQCCNKNCKKWRYCDDFHDPVNVPKYWYCKMNSEKTIASCSMPNEPITKEMEEDLIENKYNAGSLVWGRVDGYPWWPAIVDDCPETIRFYELKKPSIIPVKYHVTFFKDNLQHAWLNLKNIKTFIKSRKSIFMRQQNKFDKINYKKSVEEAYILAQNAIPLSIFERLQRFSYISRLRNLQGSVIQPYEEQNDEIPSTPIEHITLKEYYLKNRPQYIQKTFKGHPKDILTSSGCPQDVL